MMRMTLLIAALSLTPALAMAQNDDFNDNIQGLQWESIEDVPAQLTLQEQNMRVEVIANAPTSASTDALYISNFLLATSQDFEIRIDYDFASVPLINAGISGNTMSLVFGVGRDLPDGTDSAAVGLTQGNFLDIVVASSGSYAYRIDDAQTAGTVAAGGNVGTMVITYDASEDDLFLGFLGETPFLLDNTVFTVWGADSLYVSFGARGNGFTLDSGDAFFDNFQIVSGSLIPEPASAALLALTGLALLRRRRTA